MEQSDDNYNFAPEWISRDLGLDFNDVMDVLKTMDIDTTTQLNIQTCGKQLGIIDAIKLSEK